MCHPLKHFIQETLKVERARGMELRRRAMQQEVVAPGDWRQLQLPAGPSSSGRQFAWRHSMDGPRSYDTSTNYITVPSSDMVRIKYILIDLACMN